MTLTTQDIELILNIEQKIQDKHGISYLKMKGKEWYLNEILKQFKKKKDGKF